MCEIDNERIIGTDGENILRTWIDALYAVHTDIRGQTGGSISMGHGTVLNKTIKQKLNTISSAETEVVGVSDVLPFNIWMNNFLNAHGIDTKENILFQENQSAMKMEKNRRMLCTGNSRHISIVFFCERLSRQR